MTALRVAGVPMSGAERLVAASRREPVDRTPVWFMRQAGGSLPAYLALRERRSVEEIATTPELCAQVSLMPVDAYGVDGAVMFADIMLPVAAMGIELELTPAGPVVAAPIRTPDDVARLHPIDAETDLRPILEAIRLVRHDVGDRAAVIGIVGGPFTLASYLIEGGPSRDKLVAKAFMYREPVAFAALLRRLTDALVGYVAAQVRAGARIVQVFDSWAGTLGPADYVERVAPSTAELFAAAAGVPTIHFVAGSAGILDHVAATGGDVISIDAGQSLAAAWARLGDRRGVQGNLDPARLLAGWAVVEAGARTVLDEAGDRPGHVFNLGHAIPRGTDPGILRDLASFVHEQTPRPSFVLEQMARPSPMTTSHPARKDRP
ncbi:MAG: uroporphyrinogen decarboxylase [Candidatus Limnocylindrales bacterium]